MASAALGVALGPAFAVGLLLPLVLVLPAPVASAIPQPATDAHQATRDTRDTRPNIVVVMADDMRVDDLRFAPNVRRLIGRHGLTFDNSFSPYPLCCPARASFLTGMYTHNHGIYSVFPPSGYGAFDDSATLATSLHRAGYQTGFVGKYLNGYGPDLSKVSGQPSYRYVPRGWTDWRAAFGDPHVPGIHGGVYDFFDTPYNVNGHVDNSYRGRYQTGVVGDLSVAMAQRFSGTDEPFFMWVNYVAPHHGAPFEDRDPGTIRNANGHLRYWPSTVSPSWVHGRFDQLVRRGSGMPKDGGPAEADVSDKPYRFRHRPEFTQAERQALAETTRQRAEAVFVLDRHVARLVARLKQTDEWADTVFMFTSDNGYYLGEHRRPYGKWYAHEPSLRVPFLVTGPGMRSGTHRFDPISTVDVAATVLDLADARAPHPADGASKLETMWHGDSGWSVPVVTEAINTSDMEPRRGFNDPRTTIGLRTARYSFTVYRSGAIELYDLATDPLQLHNLGRHLDRHPARQPVIAALRAAWWRFKDCAGPSCRATLPARLVAGPAAEERLTRNYWRAVDRAYGW